MPGLEDLYREIILDHYRNPRNRGELASPPAHRSEGFNPLCGDEIIVFIDVESGKVADIAIEGQGCSISQSSASMMSAAVKGKTIAEVRGLISTFKAMMSIHEATLDSSALVTDPDVPEAARGASNAVTSGDAGDYLDDEGDDAPEGVTQDEIDALGDLAALQGVVKFPVRIKCATLSWNTLAQCLNELESSPAG